MNLSIWFGVVGAIGVLTWGVYEAGSTTALFNLHGLLVVLGGTGAATLIHTSFGQLWSAFRRAALLFLPSPVPSMEDVSAEIVRLARKAQAEGGLLSLQGDAREVAGGFLHRAIMVAISAGETSETRRIIEAEIRNLRISRNEDANVFRTIAVLSPMFGLLGTLLGMIRVLETMSEPTKVGPAMALALSSAFFGITIANLICVPIAGQMRLEAMKETALLELIVEGVIDIAAGKSPFLVELHLAAYVQQRKAEIEALETAAPAPAGAAR